MKTIKYYLGIDGGGTKTEFALSSADGTVNKTYISTGCNPNDIGIEKCLDVIKSGCEKICNNINFSEISVFAGIAGAGSTAIQNKIKEEFYLMGFGSADCAGDTLHALEATLGSDDGIAVIIGTGVAVIVRHNGNIQTIGGYNYFFDKGGSAFNLGRDAIYYSLLCEERNLNHTPLYEAVKSNCETETVKENLKKFYNEGKQYIAKFAHCVTDTIYTDENSFLILENNVKTVAEQINFALDICNTDCIYFVGGLTDVSEMLEPIFSKYIKKPCNLSFYKKSLTDVALKLARKEISEC